MTAVINNAALGEYHAIWDVLNAIMSVDADLSDLVKNISRESGESVQHTLFLDDYVSIGNADLQANLEQLINIKILERLKDSWEYMYGKAKAFKKQYGTIAPREVYKIDQLLGRWLWNQRSREPDKYKKELLSALGFNWDTREDKAEKTWMNNFLKYKQNKSNCAASWASIQKQKFVHGELKDHHINLLKSINFDFELLHTFKKRNHMQIMEEFILENKHSFPSRKEMPTLHQWASRMRSHFNKGILLSSKIEALKKIGFEFESCHTFIKSKSFNHLLEFKKKNGHLNCVSKKDKKVYDRIMQYKWEKNKGILSQEKIDALNSIGFDFTMKPYSRFNYKLTPVTEHPYFSCFIEHVRKHQGKCPYVNNKISGLAGILREKHRDGELHADTINILNSANFKWSRND